MAATRPSIPLFSNLTGGQVTEELSDAGYWVRQARGTVRFADCVTAAASAGFDTFLEVGGEPVLLSLVRECLGPGVRGFASLRSGTPEPRQMATALGGLFEAGARPDWARFFGGSQRAVRSLPRYPFQHRPYWLRGGAGGLSAIAAPVPDDAGSPEPAPPSGLGPEALVRSRIAQITGHPTSELGLGTRLDDLGLSSIGLVELAAALATDFPAMARVSVEWADVSEVGHVVDLVRPYVGAETLTALPVPAGEEAASVDVPDASSSVEIVVAPSPGPLRGDPGDVVLDSIVVRAGGVEARIVVDETHPFFFDHPYDHVPGVLFVEAVQQLGEWLHETVAGESRGLFQPRSLTMRFETWGDLDADLSIATESLMRDGRGWIVRGSIGAEEVCARFELRFESESPEREDPVGTEPSAPARRELVHKVHAENVLISEPSVSGEGVVATALPPAVDHALARRSAGASLTQLVEWARQFLTARAHAVDQESFEERFILLSVHIRLDEPVSTRQPRGPLVAGDAERRHRRAAPGRLARGAAPRRPHAGPRRDLRRRWGCGGVRAGEVGRSRMSRGAQSLLGVFRRGIPPLVTICLAVASGSVARAEVCDSPKGDGALVIVAMDGVPFSVVERARAEGVFGDWPEPRPMISTFPSLTNVSFAAILAPLGAEPVAGYEIPHFDRDEGRMVGKSLRGAKDRAYAWRDLLEKERIGIWGHTVGYAAPRYKAFVELEDLEEKVLASPRQLLVLLVAATDAMTHFNGYESTLRFLHDFSERIAALQEDYRHEHGECLRLVLLSDHGNTEEKVRRAKGLRKRLKRSGFRLTSRLEGPGRRRGPDLRPVELRLDLRPGGPCAGRGAEHRRARERRAGGLRLGLARDHRPVGRRIGAPAVARER